ILDDLARTTVPERPELIVIHHSRNQGVGGAMASGFEKALQLDLDILVKVDGDGQMDPEFMIELVEPLANGHCDYAKGNRFLHFDALRLMPLSRKLGSILLTFLTKIASGYWHVFDPQNGYLAVRQDFLRFLNLERLRNRRYFFENEMLIELNIDSARVLDCPMPSIYGGEVSSLRVSQVMLYFPVYLFRGFFSRLFHRYVLRDFSVVVPLYLLGALSFGWGVYFGILTWWRSDPAAPTPTATIMLSVLPLILGMQMLLQGLLFEILQTPRAEITGQRRPRRRPVSPSS
ncbi:glycosyltransferase family 2 protein, partial [bacterium]|nr:glycosyltransferase family 2 protein [bacterium]